MRKINLFWRLNEQIRAPEVRVIGEDGKQLGIMKIEEAVKVARERKLTLVEIAPTAKPPVTKIVEFGKFRYQEEKKAKSQLKKSKGGELKEIRFSPFIAENDYLVRFTKVKEFLGEKNKVRLVVVFKGPQMRSKQFGYNLLAKIVSEFGDTISVDMKPKFLGKHLMMVISPTNKIRSVKKQEGVDKNAKTENQKITN